MTDEAKLQRAADLLRQQSAKIRELEAEIDRLNTVIEGSCDALAHLQKIYSDPRNPPSVVTKAAGLAVGFERAKPPTISAHVDAFSLFDRLEKRRMERQRPVIDLKPDPAA
jgi:hypothetical protein